MNQSTNNYIICVLDTQKVVNANVVGGETVFVL
jgi:hypothetical protein